MGAGRERPVFSSLFLTQHKMKGSAHLWLRSGRNSDHLHLRRRVFVLLPPGMAAMWAVKVKFPLKVHMRVTSDVVKGTDRGPRYPHLHICYKHDSR